jgi:ankyrin repeat protein
VKGHVEVVALLLVHSGMEANKAETDNGFTPLFIACEKGHVEVVRLLLGHAGMEANKAATDDGCTPLYMACQNRKVEVVRLLLGHSGIEANKAQTDNRCTPLFIACLKGYVEVVRLLLVAGARTDLLTSSGHTCMEAAQGHSEVVAVLEANRCLVRRQCTCCGCGAQNGVKLKPCPRCKGPLYCGKECQSKHWELSHKKSCSSRARTEKTCV